MLRTMNKSTIVLIIVAVILALIVGIYALMNYRANHGSSSSKLGDDVKITNKNGSIATGKKAQWPKDMPEIVPEFKYGTIQSSSTTDVDDKKSWIVVFKDIPTDTPAKYKTELTDKGWVVVNEISLGPVYTIQSEKDDWEMFFTGDINGKTLSIVIKPKK